MNKVKIVLNDGYSSFIYVSEQGAMKLHEVLGSNVYFEEREVVDTPHKSINWCLWFNPYYISLEQRMDPRFISVLEELGNEFYVSQDRKEEGLKIWIVEKNRSFRIRNLNDESASEEIQYRDNMKWTII